MVRAISRCGRCVHRDRSRDSHLGDRDRGSDRSTDKGREMDTRTATEADAETARDRERQRRSRRQRQNTACAIS